MSKTYEELLHDAFCKCMQDNHGVDWIDRYSPEEQENLRREFYFGAEWQTKQSPWISVKEQLPIPVIEVIDGNEYGSIDVLGAIQNSYGDYDYYICRYWGYNKEYRWENEIAPDYWMYIPKFN